MNWRVTVPVIAVVFLMIAPVSGESDDIDDVLMMLNRNISGNRARDYTMRLWQYDKWSTLPMWQKTAEEVRTIMHERGFDEAEIVKTPADGVTKYGDWTNPIGWDVRRATLEVIEPAGLPDEYRYLCNYSNDPTSLNNYSCPTPPEGIVAEVAVLEESTPEALAALNARGKVILVSSGSRGMKRYLDQNGVPGVISDEIESANRDLHTVHQWLNGWSDLPGGWQMRDADSKNNFGFSVSQKQGNYLRGLIRRGLTVKVRAKIDSRYFTDDFLPYITGSVRGTGDEEVLIGGHMFEWGANDNCTGCASILEAVGTLNDLIVSGALPRPKRTIRTWMGFEKYGSMAFIVHNLDRLHRTIACVNCDTPAGDYDHYRTSLSISMNFNACPSFTDAVFPEIAGRYHELYAPDRMWHTMPFRTGQDNIWGEPMIGVPLNAISYKSWGHLHHNSQDTIDKVDPRTLGELSLLNAAYMYYMADAGFDDLPLVAELMLDRGLEVIREKSGQMRRRLLDAEDGAALGRISAEGARAIEYYAGLQKQAIASIGRIATPDEKEKARGILKTYEAKIDDVCGLALRQFREAVEETAKRRSIRIERYTKEKGPWEQKAGTIIPKRNVIGTVTLESIPVAEWKEVRSCPRWWGARNWASASYFWCDGKRNLNEIKELVELEAGVPVRNFDLVEYYTFLEQHGIVEFVR